MSRSNRAEWAKRVERWRDSGLTAKEYAAETGLNASTLSYWKWRLGSESKAAAEASTRRGRARGHTVAHASRGSAPPSSPKRERLAGFTELAAEVVTVPPASMLEVVLGDFSVRVPVGLDDETLTRVVRAVGAAR